jgi:hypothetical protein
MDELDSTIAMVFNERAAEFFGTDEKLFLVQVHLLVFGIDRFGTLNFVPS